MKAQFVYENINFEREKDPNESMGWGNNDFVDKPLYGIEDISSAESVDEDLNAEGDILTLEDLAEITARTQEPDSKEIAERAFIKYYKKVLETKGNAGVIKAFLKTTDLRLKTIVRGKYMIVYDKY